jgi:hypothetical protein
MKTLHLDVVHLLEPKMQIVEEEVARWMFRHLVGRAGMMIGDGGTQAAIEMADDEALHLHDMVPLGGNLRGAPGEGGMNPPHDPGLPHLANLDTGMETGIGMDTDDTIPIPTAKLDRLLFHLVVDLRDRLLARLHLVLEVAVHLRRLRAAVEGMVRGSEEEGRKARRDAAVAGRKENIREIGTVLPGDARGPGMEGMIGRGIGDVNLRPEVCLSV